MPQFSILNLIVNALFLVIGLALGYFVGAAFYRKIVEAKLGAA